MEVLEPFLIRLGCWVASVAGVMLVVGVAGGLLGAHHTTRGKRLINSQRGHVKGFGVVAGLSFITAFLAPGVTYSLPRSGLAIGLACAAALLYVHPFSRPFAYAAAAAQVTAGLVVLPFIVLLLLMGAGWNWDLARAVWIVFALTGAVGGFFYGLQTRDAVESESPPSARVRALVSEFDAQIAPIEGRAFKWTGIWLATLGGAAIIALLVVAFRDSGSMSVAAVLGAVGAAPLGCALTLAGIRRWMSWWTRPVSQGLIEIVSGTERCSGVTSGVVLWAFILSRYRTALCDSCLRWSHPLESAYDAGHRHCEQCGGEISRPGAGRLVALVGSQTVPDGLPRRVFVRHSSDLVTAGAQVDVTHIRVGQGDRILEEFATLVSFLCNTPPSHRRGLRDIRVYCEDRIADLPPNTRGLTDNYLSWGKGDPLSSQKA